MNTIFSSKIFTIPVFLMLVGLSAQAQAVPVEGRGLEELREGKLTDREILQRLTQSGTPKQEAMDFLRPMIEKVKRELKISSLPLEEMFEQDCKRTSVPEATLAYYRFLRAADKSKREQTPRTSAMANIGDNLLQIRRHDENADFYTKKKNPSLLHVFNFVELFSENKLGQLDDEQLMTFSSLLDEVVSNSIGQRETSSYRLMLEVIKARAGEKHSEAILKVTDLSQDKSVDTLREILDLCSELTPDMGRGFEPISPRNSDPKLSLRRHIEGGRVERKIDRTHYVIQYKPKTGRGSRFSFVTVDETGLIIKSLELKKPGEIFLGFRANNEDMIKGNGWAFGSGWIIYDEKTGIIEVYQKGILQNFASYRVSSLMNGDNNPKTVSVPEAYDINWPVYPQTWRWRAF